MLVAPSLQHPLGAAAPPPPGAGLMSSSSSSSSPLSINRDFNSSSAADQHDELVAASRIRLPPCGLQVVQIRQHHIGQRAGGASADDPSRRISVNSRSNGPLKTSVQLLRRGRRSSAHRTGRPRSATPPVRADTPCTRARITTNVSLAIFLPPGPVRSRSLELVSSARGRYNGLRTGSR